MRQAPKRLTEQQKAFARNYTVHFNATKAAIQSGYSEKSAHVAGHDLMKHPLVRKEIDAILKATGDRHTELRHRVIKELAQIAFANIKNYGRFTSAGLELIPSDELDDDVAAAIQEFHVSESEKSRNVRFKLASKERALEMLGRHLGMFTADAVIAAVEPLLIHRPAGDKLELGMKTGGEEPEDDGL